MLHDTTCMTNLKYSNSENNLVVRGWGQGETEVSVEGYKVSFMRDKS